MTKRVIGDGKGGTREIHLQRNPQPKNRGRIEFEAREVVPLTDRGFEIKDKVFVYDTVPGVESGMDDDGLLFDRFGRFMMTGFEHFVRYLHLYYLIPAETVVLDVACGYGELGKLLYTERKNNTYVGIDISKNKIKGAVKLRWGSSKTMFLRRDLSRPLPFPDETFDVVVSTEFIEHVPKVNAENFLAEVGRITKPGGMIMVTTPNADVGFCDPVHIVEYGYQEAIDMIEKVGFEITARYGLKLGSVGENIRRWDRDMRRPEAERELKGAPAMYKTMREALPPIWAKTMFALENPELCWLNSLIGIKRRGVVHGNGIKRRKCRT